MVYLSMRGFGVIFDKMIKKANSFTLSLNKEVLCVWEWGFSGFCRFQLCLTFKMTATF